MIRSYKFVKTDHQKLHEWVMAFFKKLQAFDGEFSEDLFEKEFLPVVKGHPKVLKKAFEEIFDYVKALGKSEKEDFLNEIIEANEIENICTGHYKPKCFDPEPEGIELTLKELFSKLYRDVLDGAHFRLAIKKNLRDHFNEFSDLNEDITLCPMCGIGELKKSADKTRDQYDHYLPKTKYPFSSVNFYNLVPCCMECNSLQVKGDKDIVSISNGRLFFPYEENYEGLMFIPRIINNDVRVENIHWEFEFFHRSGRKQEIESWKAIYDIDLRYKGYVAARVKKWYKTYINYSKVSNQLSDDMKKTSYLQFLESREKEGLLLVEKSILEELLNDPVAMRAQEEASLYSG